MPSYITHFWKKAPFLRLLLFMMAGIIVQWQLQLVVYIWVCVIAASLILLFSSQLLSFFKRFKLSFINGTAISMAFAAFGALLAWKKDIRNDKNWLGYSYSPEDMLIVSLDEPPVQKTKSVKANATVHYLLQNDKQVPVKGKIIIYFKNDTTLSQLEYGSLILFKKSLQEIKNSGNPGGFDYKRYSLFQGITHQVYLQPGDFSISRGKKERWLSKFLIDSREWVLNILRTNIKAEKELGLAEALLIGYKNDLDKTLVQSYTNTGVVHVIAISGLHLGIIYLMLVWMLKPLKKKRELKWLHPLLIIIGLWLFSLLAGAQPSVLRSALMFTCIVLGESAGRRTSIYNTLAFSAFLLLCFNPYWLWDVGFQLSYAAVLSIIIFMRPIYNCLYFKNKAVDFVWKLNAVTFAAQILTIPIGIYHFHQFPFLFFLTNFLAVPLSSIILIGEIILCVVSFIPAVALIVGKILAWLIWLMNSYVERVEVIPFALWDGLQVSIAQAILLVLLAAGLSFWLMERSATGLKWGLVALLGFVSLRSYSFIQTKQQQKVIVYNVPQKQAIDLVNGLEYFFIGDTSLLADDFARNFHLKPSRIRYRIAPVDKIPGLFIQDNYFSWQSKRILLADTSVSYDSASEKQTVDLLIISKNPRLYMSKLVNSFTIKQVVFDGSTPQWKVNYWKKDCDSLGIPYHDVTTNGAFVMNLR